LLVAWLTIEATGCWSGDQQRLGSDQQRLGSDQQQRRGGQQQLELLVRRPNNNGASFFSSMSKIKPGFSRLIIAYPQKGDTVTTAFCVTIHQHVHKKPQVTSSNDQPLLMEYQAVRFVV
jgi:hypothetical protein